MTRYYLSSSVFALGITVIAVGYSLAAFASTGNLILCASLASLAGSGLISLLLWRLLYQRSCHPAAGLLAGLLSGCAILLLALAGLYIEARYLDPNPAVFFYGTFFTALMKTRPVSTLLLVMRGWAVISLAVGWSGLLIVWTRARRKVRA